MIVCRNESNLKHWIPTREDIDVTFASQISQLLSQIIQLLKVDEINQTTNFLDGPATNLFLSILKPKLSPFLMFL